MSLAQTRKGELKRWLRDMRRGLGLLALGAGLGGSAFMMLDAMSESQQMPAHAPAFSLRGNVYYSSCRDAFLDGRTNIRRGDPGYRPQLDADNDGLACEPFLRR